MMFKIFITWAVSGLTTGLLYLVVDACTGLHLPQRPVVMLVLAPLAGIVFVSAAVLVYLVWQ